MFSRGLKILMVLLMGLVWLSPSQVVSAASDTATFTFTSVTNPSLYLVDTTFQLSASGTNGTYPPFGDVTFYADDKEIPGCTGKSLNHVNYSITADTPATCTINTLSIGEHKISAYFVSKMPDLYDSANLTLSPDHVVSYTPLTITPETLPDGQWGLGYSQILSASGSDGPFEWSRSGTFPEDFSLISNTGELYGWPGTISDTTFTVTVADHAGGYGAKTYTLHTTRVTPGADIIITGTDPLYADTPGDLSIFANFYHPSHDAGLAQPIGTASYAVDGMPVAACSGDNAKAVTGASAPSCEFNTAGLPAGDHTVTVNYTRADTDEYYNNATGTKTFTIRPERYDITGMVFYDLDKDGEKDNTEGAVDKGLNVIYDIDCNGDADRSTWSGNNITGNGSFSLSKLDGGSTFCMILELGDGETQTTTVGPLTLDGDKYFKLGVYYPSLIYTPTLLPYAHVNEPYHQTITISNGTAPYTISNVEAYLPDGLTFDPATLTLSGTPARGYQGSLTFDVTDATGFTDRYDLPMITQADGAFTLTSSANPSASGEAITFTFSGSGQAEVFFFGEMQLIPPIGAVNFYVDDVAVPTCSEMTLNIAIPFNVGDYPVTCTISGLDDGKHMIKVEYSQAIGAVYRDATRTLTQQVGVSKIYMPIIAMNRQLAQ